MRAGIPDKLYFKIGEVSKLAHVETHVLRYWESEFKEIQPKRANSNQRLYRRVDVEKILQIKELLYEKGFTISGAKKFLRTGGQTVNKPGAISTPVSRLKEIKKELIVVKKLLLQKK
jgi:DNA-binding transcriptional MerR regulator